LTHFRGNALRAPGRAWVLFCAGLMAGSVIAWWLPNDALDWQPDLALTQPWRALSAVFVHWSALHLGANLLAAAVVAIFGLSARLPLPATLAFALAWPLAHVALLLQPALLHYGGLSGMLHAGVAVGTVWLMAATRGAHRRVGAAVFVGMLVKLVLEEPWGPPLHTGGGWDIATAPIAHVTGAAAGVLTAAGMLMARRFIRR
jgi:rhomboid family GlyGly-CTERM serine protease